MHRDSLSIELKNDLAEIAKLPEALGLLGTQHALSPRLLGRVRLALEEVVTNAITHGFGGSGEHVIRIDLSVEGGTLTARVEDDGLAFDPLGQSAPDTSASLDERGVGGLGIHIVRRLMDDVQYERVGDRNVLTIKVAAG